MSHVSRPSRARLALGWLLAGLIACGGLYAGEFDLQRAEFAKYYREITGRDAPEGVIKFAIDPKVSKSGRDAYAIVSSDDGEGGCCVRDDGEGAVATHAVGGGSVHAVTAGGVRSDGAPAVETVAANPVRSVGAPRVTVTGSNLRSVWYGLYDLLERRGGCRWFWDGDVVPKKASIDLSSLDVHEEARFEYRGIRYFAHRGLTRFQAEHWGPEDWKKEIDWLLKRRLNVFMLRVGQDDLFQLSFPDVCEYPDPSKPLPGAGRGYNDRSLFWSLQYRGELRRSLQGYAFERGLMSPEDFGTMSHWYSPTPEDFLEKKNPPFLPQSNTTHSERNLRVWDVRDPQWAEAYWKLTQTALDAYGTGAGDPVLLHTIGLGERRCFKDRKANFDMKTETLEKFLALAKRDRPDAKVLLAGWDFYLTWRPEEVCDLVARLDPSRVILWDYEADLQTKKRAKSSFLNWGVVGRFPYTYSTFLAYESGLDARADYPFIEARQKIVQDDPACAGWIFWPEASHTDTLFLRFFTANAWSGKPVPHGEVLEEFCESRYGADADRWKAVWRAVLPASYLGRLGDDCDKCQNAMQRLVFHKLEKSGAADRAARWAKPVEDALAAFPRLAGIPWRDGFAHRDAIDVARMVADRLLFLRIDELGRDFAAWRRGESDGTGLASRAENIAALCDDLAGILALHSDYSLWASCLRLDAIEKVRNPAFEKTLFENAANYYCLSHQYELVRHWVAPCARALAKRVAGAVAAGDRSANVSGGFEPLRLAAKNRPLEALRPALPRTQNEFRRIVGRLISDGTKLHTKERIRQ